MLFGTSHVITGFAMVVRIRGGGVSQDTGTLGFGHRWRWYLMRHFESLVREVVDVNMASHD